jgi:HK97 family phage portal protein
MAEVSGADQRAFLQRFWERFVYNPNARASVNFNDPRVPISAETIDQFYDGPPAKSGYSVNADNALTVSAFWRGLQVLGGAASSIPFKVFKPVTGGRQEVDSKELPAAGLITKRPNRKVTWPVFIDRAINHLHMRGNHYAYIERNDFGQAVELNLWNPDTVEVYEDKNDVFYKRKNEERVYSSDEIIHVPHLGSGVVGKSVVTNAKEDLGLEMSRRDYGSGMYAGGGKPGGLLSAKLPLTDTQRQQVEKNWRETKKALMGQDVLLPFGFDYEHLRFTPAELEWLQAGDFTVPTVARWLGVPPHKLYDLTRATFSNIEHQSIEFVQDSVAPILVKFEYEYTDKLFQLPIEEKRGYYCEFNLNAYIRADLAARAEAYAKQIHSGQITPAEVRRMENRRFIEGSDRLFLNQASVPMDRADDIVDKNQKPSKISDKAMAALKAQFNGKTQEILDILDQ